tara:strand:- start:493 stop:768 length:276 start_codon:yes stop_codon:yes gene_type:complete
MTKSLLSYVYKTITKRAAYMNYSETLPSISQMSSLTKSNPSRDEINYDYYQLSKHFNHPIYINFIPTYDESKNCIKTAWLKRYLETRCFIK